jgi:CubicO group peptidase (beta-lactamase class C family)
VRLIFVASSILILSLSTLTCERPAPLQPAPAERQSQPAHSAQVDLKPIDISQVDRLLSEQEKQLGSFAVVIIQNNRIVYRKSFGNYRIDQVVPIASSSKWLAGALVMSLVDDGKLSLDAPVSKYLPEFTGDKAAITVRHLFAHTSGLPPEIGCRNNRQTTLEACAKQIASVNPGGQPGSEFFYGGVSMHAGGRVVEVVTGKSWNDAFVERIAKPSGMTHTDFFAYGPTSNPRPAGDARSTLDDYAKFLQMILNGGELNGQRVLSANAVEEMHRDQTRGSTIAYSIFGNKGHLDPALPGSRYGVGMWGEKTDAQSGRILLASSPGALGSYPWIDFENKVAAAIFTRGTFSRTLPVYLRLRETVRQMGG